MQRHYRRMRKVPQTSTVHDNAMQGHYRIIQKSPESSTTLKIHMPGAQISSKTCTRAHPKPLHTSHPKPQYSPPHHQKTCTRAYNRPLRTPYFCRGRPIPSQSSPYPVTIFAISCHNLRPIRHNRCNIPTQFRAILAPSPQTRMDTTIASNS